MSLTTSRIHLQPKTQAYSPPGKKTRLYTWFLNAWEIYPIILVASFLRLYRIDTTQFDLDQVNIFRMAYYAVHHGMLVATSNASSLGTINPPAIVYLLMPTAVFSANPLWAAVWVAFLAIVSVLLTYIFTRRYYGRLAGTFAAFLYATVLLPVFYSRFTWNQNLLIPLVPLFFMALFWGVVERRKGWLVPALFLLGLMYQLHGSSLLLAPALLVSVVLAPGTIRWRDLLFASIALLILYAPYLLWEIHSNFSDIYTLLLASKQPSHIDNQAILSYQSFLKASNPWSASTSLAGPFLRLIGLVNRIMTLLLILAGVATLSLIVWPRKRDTQIQKQEPVHIGLWRRLRHYWSDLRADTYLCSLIMLLVWQVIPVLLLSRHAIVEFLHYFIFLMPGQYILIALLLARVAGWFQKFKGWGRLARSATCLLAMLIIAVQATATMAYVSDAAHGRFSDGYPSYYYSNDLSSLQHALSEAEQVAQQHHLKHLYISLHANYDTMQNMGYLAEHIHTPTTVFTDKCLILPDPAAAPAVLLVGPYNSLTDALLPRFASATLVDEPGHLGGDPFKLYIVETMPARAAVKASLPQGMQLLDTQQVSFQNAPWVAMRWNVMNSAPMRSSTTYAYRTTSLASNHAQATSNECFYTSMQAGDQLLTAFPLQSGNPTPTALDIQFQSYTVTPVSLQPAPGIPFVTGALYSSPPTVIQTIGG